MTHLLPCKNCGSANFDSSVLRVRCRSCGAAGPWNDTDGAKWNSMQSRQDEEIRQLRDALNDKMVSRVDMMAAAIVAYKLMLSPGTDSLDEISVARAAISQIRAIDVEIEKREREKQIEEVELMARLREQEALK